MKKFLKIITLLTVALLCFTLFACGGPEEDNSTSPLATNYEYELNGDGDGYVLTKYVGDKTLSKITLPDKISNVPVTELGKNLFRKTNVVEVVLPDSVTIIGEGAFNACTKLTTVNTANVQYFKTSSFEGCSVIASVNLSSAKNIGTKAFKDCVKLTQVSIPSTCQSLQPSCFSGCTRLNIVTLGEGVKEIGTEAFTGCSALSTINLDKVLRIGEKSFSSCISLKTISLDSVSIIDKNAFQSCSVLETVTVGEDCILVYANSFVFCYRLESLQFAPYDNSNKWMSVDYNLQNPEVVWPHYLNTYGLIDPAKNAENFGTTMGNPKKDNYYCKRAYLDQYPTAFNVSYALAHDVKGCTCMSNGMPTCNFTVNGQPYTTTQITLKVGESITFGAFLSWGPGVQNKTDTVTISSVKLNGNWLQEADYGVNGGTVYFKHTFSGTLDLTVYNSTTSNIMVFNITVVEAD